MLASLRETTGASQKPPAPDDASEEGSLPGEEPPAYNDEQVAQWLADAGDDSEGPALAPAVLAVAISAPKAAEKVLPPLADVVSRIAPETIQLIEEEFQVRFNDVKWFRSDKLA